MSTEETGIVMVERDELARVDARPAEQRARALAVAGAVREIVLACTQDIQGKRYVKVEGWQAIANTYGCVASAGGVERVPAKDGEVGGWLAHGTVRHLATDRIIGEGEGFVGEDEKMWMSRALYARRGMAQTRAISRACRAAFAFIVPMIDARLQTTPAEEMPEPHTEEEVEDSPRMARNRPGRSASPAVEPPPAHDAMTGEVVQGDEDEYAGLLRLMQKATTKAEAYKVASAAPPAFKSRLFEVYRTAWATK